MYSGIRTFPHRREGGECQKFQREVTVHTKEQGKAKRCLGLVGSDEKRISKGFGEGKVVRALQEKGSGVLIE